MAVTERSARPPPRRAVVRVLAAIRNRAPPREGLGERSWVLDAVTADVAVLYVLVTLVGWLVYLRRPDLDATGAKIVGELRVRIANLHRDDTD